jgi:hypothetical protein
MQHQIGALLCKDRADCMERVGTLIESKLTGGNVQEDFRHLKGQYRTATDVQQLTNLELKPFYGLFSIYARRLTPWIGSSAP